MDAQDKPLVSVIIPTHNRARLLQEALASVRAQEGSGEHFVMEVVVIDDASTDATPEVVQRFDGIKYIRFETNQGLPAARNAGIRASAGKYVAFLDDDDLWLPYKLTHLVRVPETHPEIDVVYGQVIVRFENNVSVWPESRDAPSGSVFPALLMRGNFAGMNSILVRREVFEKAGYFDESLRSNVDYDMSLRLAFHCHFRFVPGPVAIYRLSKRGVFLTAVAEGHSNFRYVVEKALAMIPAPAQDYPQMSREARARASLRIVELLEKIGDFERMRVHLLKALEEFPWMAGEPWARSSIARKVRQLALASTSPIAAAREFCAEVRSMLRLRNFKERMAVRHLFADAWEEVATGLRDNGSYSAAGYAASSAILHDPFTVRRALFRIMARAVLTEILGVRSVPQRKLRESSDPGWSRNSNEG